MCTGAIPTTTLTPAGLQCNIVLIEPGALLNTAFTPIAYNGATIVEKSPYLIISSHPTPFVGQWQVLYWVTVEAGCPGP